MKKLIAVSILTAAILTQAHAGITYTAVTKTDGKKNKQQPDMAMTIKGTVQGPMMKMEYAENSSPFTPAGSYLLTKDAGKLMYLVNPAEKSYTEWDLEKMMAGAGAAMQMAKGMMSMKFSTPKVEKVLDEAGPAIHGYPTKHQKFITTYTTDITMMGMKMSSSVKQEEEIWSTDKLTDAGFKAWEKSAMKMKTGDEEFDKMLAASKPKITGFPLKTISVNTTTDQKGKSQTTKTTMEVTELKDAKVPASAFEIPSTYTKKEMTLPEEAPERNHSRKGRQNDSDENGEAAEAANALMNLFGGKK